MLRMVRALWNLKADFLINERIPFKLYQSKRSNLRVAVADVPGPMVNGLTSFVTEVNTDDGLPHTLEHLVFMGSKRYPFKGVLDLIANRCLASGTNAMTQQDNTCYSLTTVGSKGFIKVLPIYLDHLLSPTLNDAQYCTEVHHIDGIGNDSGVVYSEMQDHESEMETIVDTRRKELVYPKNPSYRADTGGRLGNLRTSCSNAKVREYHALNYHLNNMLITVCGKIDHDELLQSIEPVEEVHLANIPANFSRPFQTPVAPITEQRIDRIICPADDESVGIVEMSWLGPPATNIYENEALLVLTDYLTETAAAPLKRDFVLVDDPFCSSVYISMLEQSTCEMVMGFHGVPVAKLGDIRTRFFDKTVTDHQKPSDFDMERMGFLIDQQIKRCLSKMENNAFSKVSNILVGYQIYGVQPDPDNKDLMTRLNEISVLKKLRAEPPDFWLGLFKQIFTDKYICVEAQPSEAKVEEISKAEKERIEKQKKELGEEGLKRCAQTLEQAIEANTANKPSDELLEQLIVQELERFNMIPVETVALEGPATDPLSSLLTKLPFTTVLHKVPSDFVDMTILIDTSKIPYADRQFLMIWFELMFQSPAIVNGVELPYEEISKLSTKDLVSNSMSVGVSGVYDRYISLKLRVDVANFNNLSKWTDIYLRKIIFDPKRIAVCAKKLISYASESKRDGDNMAALLSTTSTYQQDANVRLYNYIALEKFHKAVAKSVEATPGQVIERLDQLRQQVLQCPVQVHFACDQSKLDEKNRNGAPQDWTFIGHGAKATSHNNPFKANPGEDADWSVSGKSRAIGVGGTESAFLIQKAHYDCSWHDPKTMHALLLSQYLTQCEGPLWNSVRGKGLAYHVSVYPAPDRKAVTLYLYRCSQVALAYEQTKKTVLEILESNHLEEAQFEAAKRSLVCRLIGEQSSVKATAQNALLSTIRSIDPMFTLRLCSEIWHASAEETLAKGSEPFINLFDESKAVRSIAVNPSKIKELLKEFPGTEIVKLDTLQIEPPTL